MLVKLTKAKITEFMSFINKVESCTDHAIFMNDGVYPVTICDNVITAGSEKINGYNFIQYPNMLDIKNDCIYLYTIGNIDKLKEHMKQTGLRSLWYSIDEKSVCVHIEDSIYTILTSIPTDHIVNVKLYNDYNERLNELTNILQWNTSTKTDIIKIINGDVTVLSDNYSDGFVRVSKSSFPLMGVVKLDDELALKFQYAFTKSKNNDTCVVFNAQYKKLNAIHAISYIYYNK